MSVIFIASIYLEHVVSNPQSVFFRVYSLSHPNHRTAQIAAADWTRGAGAGTDAVTARIRAHCDRFETLYEEAPVEIAAAAAAPAPAESVPGAEAGNQHADSEHQRLQKDDGGKEAQHNGAWFDVLLRATSFDEPRIAQRIAALSIDVLVDLQGWSDGRRLTALCARAAPIQVFACAIAIHAESDQCLIVSVLIAFFVCFVLFHFCQSSCF